MHLVGTDSLQGPDMLAGLVNILLRPASVRATIGVNRAMRHRISTGLLVGLGLISQCGCLAARNTTQSLPGNGAAVSAKSTNEVYKTAETARLALNIYQSAPANTQTARPAIVLFFGGGWSSGSPQQFEFQARYFASRGMVAITPDYRVRSRHQSRVIDSVADAKSAMRWVRANAKRLGIDPNRIAAGGGSAGGHLAAATAFIPKFDDPQDDQEVSAIPNALVLFNPALMLAPLPGTETGNMRGVPDRSFLGADAADISPAHHVKPGAPPTIIFHGRADTTVPFRTAEIFAERMKAEGNPCQLVDYPGQGHGFFNQDPNRTRTLALADEFLTELGWLKER